MSVCINALGTYYAFNAKDSLVEQVEECSNIRNNPVMQDIHFTPTNARYLCLKAVRMVKECESAVFSKVAVQ